MLHPRTNSDLAKLVGRKINALASSIYMALNVHKDFGQFKIHLDKDVVCCVLSVGHSQGEVDVTIRVSE